MFRKLRLAVGTYVEMSVSVKDPAASHGLRTVGQAALDGSTVGMRVPLRPDRAPDGWSSDEWSLPDQGTISVYVTTEHAGGGQKVQHLDSAEVDLAAVPPLPEDAEEQATEDC